MAIILLVGEKWEPATCFNLQLYEVCRPCREYTGTLNLYRRTVTQRSCMLECQCLKQLVQTLRRLHSAS